MPCPAACRTRCLLLLALTLPAVAAPARGQELPPGERIVFLGDSITDQGGFLPLLAERFGAETVLINRGLNGGIAGDLLDGAAIYGDEQPPLIQVLLEDRPNVVVVFLGINDLMQPRAPGLEGFAEGIRRIVGEAQAAGARVVLATPALAGELPDGRNPHDEAIDSYAGACSGVAARTGAVFVDLRAAMMARLDAQPADRPRAGCVTYDGIHMTAEGNRVLAAALGDGIVRAVEPALLPAPQRLERSPGWRRLPSGEGQAPLRLVTTTAEAGAHAAVLAADLQRLGVAVALAPNRAGDLDPAEGPALRLAITGSDHHEAFTLDTDHASGDIQLVGNAQPGLAWASAALLQLLERTEAGIFLPRVRVADAPAFGYRGLLVDVARQFHPVEALEGIIELCRFHRIRWLQLHLSDDQSFTFPSALYPELATPGRSYTREELVDLQAFAAARGVTLVPELDLPGHSTAMRRALPAVFDAVDPVTGKMIDLSVINLGRAETMEAVSALIGEVAEVFAASPYLHVGGDEAWLGRLHLAPETAPALAALGSADQHELFLRGLLRMHQAVAATGKTTLMWESFRGTGSDLSPIPPEVVVMAWETAYELPQDLLASGYPVVNASWKPLYITPGRRFDDESLLRWNPWRWENWVPQMPSYEPIQLSEHPAVIGGQFCAWEMAPEDQLGALRPRLPLIAERLWSAALVEHPAERLRRRAAADLRFGELFQPVRMLAEGLLAPPGARHRMDQELVFGEQAVVHLWPAVPGSVLRYALDGAPLSGSSPVADGPVLVERTTRLRARAFGPDGTPVGAEASWRFLQNPVAVVEDGLLDQLAWLEPGRPPRCFGAGLSLRLSSRILGATVRYTLDGSEPGLESTAAPAEPLLLRAPARLRARCFDAEGRPRGETWARDYRQVDYEQNLATGRPVTASDHVRQHKPEYAVDGSVLLERYWDASSGGPHWLVVDLEGLHELSELRLWPYWDGGRYYQYTVELSADGERWTEVVDASANTTPSSAAGHRHRFAPTAARYVRVNMLHNSANPGLHIVELRVY